ncbi:MAG: DUF1573 domain-containing protein [Burkholderiaceae bacterium]|nr:DUF1573 domain-containing protein [Burkholderiaceae bacterium]
MAKPATAASSGAGSKSTEAAAAATGSSKNKKFLIAAALVVVGVGAMVIAGMPDKNAPSTAATSAQPGPAANSPVGAGLRSSEYQFDFGSISMAAGKVSHRYYLANGGQDPVVIRKLYTSCMCTTAEFVKGIRRFGPFGMQGHTDIPSINQSFAPGERAYVEVVFDPAAHGPAGVGPIERVVTIENSAGQPMQLAFSAYVKP